MTVSLDRPRRPAGPWPAPGSVHFPSPNPRTGKQDWRRKRLCGASASKGVHAAWVQIVYYGAKHREWCPVCREKLVHLLMDRLS